MTPDMHKIYAMMYESRLYEEGITRLWNEGLISGEMHLGTGEEAIMAGIISQLRPGDALALDHRGTAPLLMVGVDPIRIIRELLGRSDGLCGGKGGHMHLFSKDHLAASSGIVGASGPAAAGFALAAQQLRPGTVAVAFFGEGAMNQGMLMEAVNLAAVWNLPVIFICKDDAWSITTASPTMTGGDLCERARGSGVCARMIDGNDVTEVWTAASEALNRARAGKGPTFLHARCVHLEGHFLGYQMIRLLRHPLQEMPRVGIPLMKTLLQRGSSLQKRIAGIHRVFSALVATWRDPRRNARNDPLKRTRALLQNDPVHLENMEKSIEQQVNLAIAAALAGGAS